MPFYSYCVARLDLDEPWQVFSGVDERPVFVVREQKIALLASRLDRLRLNDPRHLVQHGQVVHRVFEQRTVLPFRYGTVFDSQEQMEVLLRQNYYQFTEALRQLRGKAEVHVKVQFRAPDCPKTGPGRLTVSAAGYALAPEDSLSSAYTQGQADSVTRHLSEALRPLSEQVSTRLSGEWMLMDLRYLVEEATVPEWRKLSRNSLVGLEDCQVNVNGPWPPYHFLPLTAKLPARGTAIPVRPGRLPLRARAARA